MDTAPRELRYVDGFLPIGDHGLIGDGRGAALVGRDGTIDWMCVPRFDSDPLFCSLLDAERGGRFALTAGELAAARQEYVEDTGVLVTELTTRTGVLRITDAMLLRSGADLREDQAAGKCTLLRKLEVVHGTVAVRVELRPRGGHRAEPYRGGLRIRWYRQDELPLAVWATRPLPTLDESWELGAGAPEFVVLGWGGVRRPRDREEAEQRLQETIAAWERWAQYLQYDGPRRRTVRRSAITLKLLDYFENGALIAAPTTSLPEQLGGVRNWDYRFAWIRDAAFSVFALRRIGMGNEAYGFLRWVLDAIEHHGRPSVLYDLDAQLPAPERVDEELSGYRGAWPVRWGNAAAEQVQHDVFGEILDCAWQWARGREHIDRGLWTRLAALADAAQREWRVPDQGIWEVRTVGRPFTYSAALCHVALDRATRLSEALGLPGQPSWRTSAEDIVHAILHESWDPKLRSLTEHLGGGGLDASLLALPLRRLFPATHPRMVATTEAIRRRLGTDGGLMFRYLPRESPDGLPGDEGAFLLCSFWLVDNLALQGRRDEAQAIFESLCDRAGVLGLLPEQIDPATGEFLGNYPQALSHVGLVSSAVLLQRLARGDTFRTTSTAADVG